MTGAWTDLVEASEPRRVYDSERPLADVSILAVLLSAIAPLSERAQTEGPTLAILDGLRDTVNAWIDAHDPPPITRADLRFLASRIDVVIELVCRDVGRVMT